MALRKGLIVLLKRVKDGKETRLVKKAEVSPVELDSIIFTVKGSSVTLAVLMEAAKYGIDVVLMDNWRPVARLMPASYGGSMKLWHAQLKAYVNKDRRTRLASSFALGKVSNQRSNLLYMAKLTANPRLSGSLRKAADYINSISTGLSEAKDVNQVRQIEAAAAREYWRSIAKLIPRSLGFKMRLKKYSLPKGSEVDPLNIALNISYGMLQKEVWRAIFAVGLNPYVGFLHVPRPGRLSLVFDLMEEFRPVIDRALIVAARRQPSLIAGVKDNDAARLNVVKITAKSLNEIRDNIWTQARVLKDALMSKSVYKPFKLGY
mgnify:CR=1 FL=1